MRGNRPTTLGGVEVSRWVEKVSYIDIGIYIYGAGHHHSA